MYKVGDLVTWIMPTDADYSYGEIVSVDNKTYIIRHIGGYYHNCLAQVHKCNIVKKEGERKNGSKAEKQQ